MNPDDPITSLPPEATTPPRNKIRVPVDKSALAADKPNYERPALERMRKSWVLPDLLVGGTEPMRAAKVVIREADETEEEYDRRNSRTVLTNYYRNTIDTHSGMPFAQVVTFDPPLPEALSYLESDADGEGRSITVLSRELLHEAMHRGLSHLLVDMQPNRDDATYADTLKRRPKLLHIKPGAALSIVDEQGKEGEDVVMYTRIAQTRTKKVGTFGEESHEVILEIDAGDDVAVTWEPDGEGGWRPIEQVAYTPDSIPMFTLYAKQTGDYEAEPAYLPLAELNRAHFQSDADQRHALSFGRRATLARTGWKENTNPAEAVVKGQRPRKKAALGYGRSLDSTNDAAKAYLVETSGAPLTAGENDLKGLEQRMERFGAQQISQGGGITATSRQLDNDRDTCNLQAWCTRTENVILHAVRSAAEMKGVKLPANQKVKIDRSFSSQGPTDDDVPTILDSVRLGMMDRATALAELKVRGVTATVDDVEEVIRRVDEERAKRVEDQMQMIADQVKADRPKPGAPAPAPDPVPAGAS
jgi:hypothetical protein